MSANRYMRELARMERLTNESEIEATLRSLARKVGYFRYVFLLKVCCGDGQTIVQALHDEQVTDFHEINGGCVDRIFSVSTDRSIPYRWTPESMRLEDGHREAGICFCDQYGLAFPVRGRAGQTAALIVALGNDRLIADSVAGNTLLFGQMLACYLYEAMGRLVASRALGPTKPLSSRELDCLRLIAKDKSTWEIASILAMSEHAAVHHIRNLMRKLEVHSRHQAVIRAALLGLIQL